MTYVPGSYAGAGYLFATLDVTGTVSDFFRWLDLDQAVHRTSWTQDNSSFFRYVLFTTLRSYTDCMCFQ